MKIEKWDDVHGNTTSDDRMVAFLESSTDSYAVLQLKHIDETDEFRFMPYWHIQKLENQPTIDHYEVVYNGPIEQSAGAAEQLEALYTRFNIDHPEDFRGHSMSVSDIVAIKQNDMVSCHYVDSIGFTELPGFLKPENYLKNAEMAMEDDYGMLDGVINNGKSPAVEDRPSILGQLKDMVVPDTPRKPSRSHPERDIE